MMPGMAANPTIFENIKLPEDQFKIHWLEWIIPNKNETLESYAKRMIEKIEHNKLIEALKTVYDPEIPVDIYELGLIYGINEENNSNIKVTMTLTAPGCPVAEEMPKWVEDAIKQVDGVNDVIVEMVFDPPWDMSLMSDEARLTLNMF